MDSDLNKGYKSKIINIFGTKYEIKHKNNNIINNKFSIYFGLTIHIFINFFSNARLLIKSLIITGSFIMIFLILWQYIDDIIIDCINDDSICPYINVNCNNLSYNETYQCILKTNFIDLIFFGINNLILLIFNLLKIIIVLYIFTIFCEICMIFINYIINKYKEHIPNIENIESIENII